MVNSGASTHATSRRDHFLTYETDDFGVAHMGNNGQTNFIGIRDICVKTSNETTLVLKGVNHIPKLQFNLYLLESWIMRDMIILFWPINGS